MSDDDRSDLAALSPDVVDLSTFEQILEMDEPNDREFSSSIVFGFFDQAETTFKDIQKSIDAKNLGELSSLGHFLKGSSATLGLFRIKDGCEKIQNLGQRKDEHGEPRTDNATDEDLVQKIRDVFLDVEHQYDRAKLQLRTFYGEHGGR